MYHASQSLAMRMVRLVTHSRTICQWWVIEDFEKGCDLFESSVPALISRHSDKRQNSVVIASCSIDVRNVSSKQLLLNQSARRKINNGSIVGTIINKIHNLLYETSFV
jgi:hypothetical protein